MKTYALITGASAGIGKAYAYAFAQRGYNLVLVARRKELLEEIQKDIVALHGVEVRCYDIDLTSTQMREQLVQAVESLPLEVLVNNAGFGDYGAFHGSVLEKQLAMVELNIGALVHMTHALLSRLQHTVANNYSKAAYVMNIGSVAGFIPGPFMANYFATKAYVQSLSEALAEECCRANSATPVHVCVVCPGPTQSEFGKVASLSGENDAFAQSFRESRWNKIPTAESLVEYSITRMLYKKRVIIHGPKLTLFYWLSRLVPRIVITKIMSGLRSTRKKHSNT